MKERNKDKAGLSAAVITKNEEGLLPSCLQSLAFADETVVVDSGSSDKTVEIARGFGCRVYVEKWKGFGPQKQSALEKCSNDWVLVIDADERVPDETQKAIEEVLKSPDAGAYSFRRKNFLHGKWIRHSDWWPDRQVRLVRKSGGRFTGTIHEKWLAEGKIKALDSHIEHRSFTDYSDMLDTLDSYSTELALKLYENGKRANSLSPVLHGMAIFIKTYILKRGFLDGFDGLVISLNKGMGSFFKYAKLIELQKTGRKLD